MGTAAFVIAVLGLAGQLMTNTADLITAVKSVHHHTDALVYRKVVKPVGHGVKKTVRHVAKNQ